MLLIEMWRRGPGGGVEKARQHDTLPDKPYPDPETGLYFSAGLDIRAGKDGEMSRPAIGITSGGRSEGYIQSRHYREFYSTPAPYVDAVRRAGGVALLIPPGEAWEDVLPLLDGVIVTGGTDIDPAEYGGDRQNAHILPADAERDASELSLVRHLLAERERPLLCICRGLQVLNVAAGGTLHEHIPDIHDEDIHRDEAGLWAMQEVRMWKPAA